MNQQAETRPEFDELFLKLKSAIERYGTIAILNAVIGHLHEIENRNDTIMHLPWRLELLIRWAYQYGKIDYSTRPHLTNLSYRRMREYIYSMFGAKDPFLTDGGKTGFRKFFFRTLHQQIPYQNEFNYRPIIRQLIWFSETLAGQRLADSFHQRTGLTIEEFFIVAIAAWQYVLKFRNRSIPLSNLKVLTPDKVEQFFKVTAMTPEQAQQYVQSHPQQVKVPYLQQLDAFPLDLFPFLKSGDEYTAYSLHTIERMMDIFVYDTLKQNGIIEATTDFGAAFEAYVEHGVQYLNLSYFSESHQRQAGFSKQVDLIVPLSTSTVLVEAKSTNLSRIARVCPNDDILVNAISDSVIDATVQIASVATELLNNKDNLNIPDRKIFFGLIVTYGLYLVNPESELWNQIIHPEVLRRLKEHGISSLPFRPENLLVIDISEYEELQSYVKQTGRPLEEILADWAQIQSSTNPQDGYILLRQYLRNQNPPRVLLDYHTDAWDNKIRSVVESSGTNE